MQDYIYSPRDYIYNPANVEKINIFYLLGFLEQNLFDRVLRRLNTSHVGFTPDKFLGVFGPRDFSGVKPPF